uniref:Methyltransferase type 11 domain-containing protein n=1 Tax=Kalanchoe fedtschenkoi TaxID=63787 RepID=A0A7N0R8M2_KALFE
MMMMMRYSSDLKGLKWQILHGYVARNLVLRGLLFISAMGIIPLMCRNGEPFGAYFDKNCTSGAVYGSAEDGAVLLSGVMKYVYVLSYPIIGMRNCERNENVTLGVFQDLMTDGLVDNGTRAVCVGEGSASAVASLKRLGVTDAFSVYREPFFSPLRGGYVYELELDDNSYDFVFSRALDRISVPALLVLEIERILRPGGVGCMLVESQYLGGLIRSATPVSAFLKSSDVLNVRAVGISYTLVSFKKRFNHVASLQHYRLPEECQSVMNNQPVLEYLEPIVDASAGQLQSSPRVSYLPEYMNVSSRNRLIYINVGAGEFVNSSIHNWLKRSYPTYSKSHHVYVIDHNVTALTSYVNSPGISFIYDPLLSGNVTSDNSYAVGELGEPVDDEGFDFIYWFKETVAPGDLVVMAMNAAEMELKLLLQLYESGDICRVDELFLRCSPSVHCKSDACGDCSELFQSLRNSGVYGHQWFGG